LQIEERQLQVKEKELVLGLPMSKPNVTMPERNVGSAYALETPMIRYYINSIKRIIIREAMSGHPSTPSPV
jgi:hypothetical protein